MHYWSAFPFVRIAVTFALGIVAAVFLPQGYLAMLGLACFCMCLLLLSGWAKRSWFFTHNGAFGLVMLLSSFGLGYLRLYYAYQTQSAFHFTEKMQAYKARVITLPEPKKTQYKATLLVQKVKLQDTWQQAKAKVDVYVKAATCPFTYGDEVLLKGVPQHTLPPMNPGEFNYKRYLSFLGIYHQHFIDTTQVQVLSSGNGNALVAAAIKQRQYFARLLQQYLTQPNQLAIAQALLLGSKSAIDNRIKETYAASGAMHVLAVSGLHVGIIYVVILLLLKLVPLPYRKPWLVAALSIPLLWGYAFITGLSPSVLRAVTLFSIIALGNAFHRRAPMINSLAVSAMVLLLYNPYLLMQVGFQLSYVAVLGIIFIYPKLRSLWMPTHRLTIFFWDVTAISLAAQIATFPLSMLYFHRFPPYFLVSNLVVIPVATLIVWLGVVFFASSFLYMPLAGWVAKGIGFLISCINAVLGIIQNLPGNQLDRLYIDIPQTWLLYALIAGIFLYAVYKHRFWALASCGCMVAFSGLVGIRIVKNNTQPMVTVYRVPYHYAIDFVQAGQRFTVIDSGLVHNAEKLKFHIKPNRLRLGVNNQNVGAVVSKQTPYGQALVWYGTSFFIQTKQTNMAALFDVVIPAYSSDTLVSLPGHQPAVFLAEKGAYQTMLTSPLPK